MGLTVQDNMKDVVGCETLVAYSFTYGNEEKLYLMDEDENERCIRISATLRDLMLDFAAIEMCGEKVA